MTTFSFGMRVHMWALHGTFAVRHSVGKAWSGSKIVRGDEVGAEDAFSLPPERKAWI